MTKGKYNLKNAALGAAAGAMAFLAAGNSNAATNDTPSAAGTYLSASGGNAGYEAGAGVSLGDYFVHGAYLSGDESGFGATLGRDGKATDFNLSAEKLGDLSQIVLGGRYRFDNAAAIANIHGGDASGADLRGEYKLLKSKGGKLSLDAMLGGFFFGLNGENGKETASGVYAGLRASWDAKYADIVAEAMGITDKDLVGDNYLAFIGICLPFGKSDTRIPHFELGDLSRGYLGRERATSRAPAEPPLPPAEPPRPPVEPPTPGTPERPPAHEHDTPNTPDTPVTPPTPPTPTPGPIEFGDGGFDGE